MRMKEPLYRRLANLVLARQNCKASSNAEWYTRHEAEIKRLVKEHMPSGSGIDCGTGFDFTRSTHDRLVFNTSYHHMNESGMYSGWTEHSVTVVPVLWTPFELRISGENRNDVKDYLHAVFSEALLTEVE